MKVLCLVLIVAVVACGAAPGAKTDEEIELFSGVTIHKDAAGEDKINVKFEPGELRDAARTFEEARGKIKKYTPLLAGLGAKFVAIAALVFGGLSLLVFKALVIAKLAFVAVSVLGVQKLLGSGGLSGGLSGLSGKIAGFQSSPQQWSSPTASAGTYPYARSSSIADDGNDLAYKAQIPS